MINKFIKTIRDHNLIEENDKILVGFSGGKDSSALLHLLMTLSKSYKIQIAIGHFNHKVRGDEANRDEEFCRQVGKDYSIDFFSDSYNMDNYAKENKISKEEAGRILRKNFFNRILREEGYNKIALAHNMDDQAETILMRIIRGTGLDGLKGIEYKSGSIIRPILDISKSEIEEYINKEKISYVEDSTNKENDYNRNKIRNLLIPEIENNYNPNFKEALINLSNLAVEDSEFLDSYTEDTYKGLSNKGEDSTVISLDAFNRQSLPIKRRLIRRVFLLENGNINNLSFKNVEDINNLSQGPTGKAIENVNGLRIRTSYNDLIFEKNKKNNDNEPNLLYTNLNKGINIINDNLSLSIEDSIEISQSLSEITIPKDLITGSLVLRNRKEGDKLRPLGLNGTKKLKDIFIDKKIPRDKRDNYYILSDEERIYWVLGLVKSEDTRMKSSKDQYIKIKINSMED